MSYRSLKDLGDDDIALGPHFEVKTCDWFRLKAIINRNRSQVFTSKCGPSAMSSSPRSSSSSMYHEDNKKEVSRIRDSAGTSKSTRGKLA